MVAGGWGGPVKVSLKGLKGGFAVRDYLGDTEVEARDEEHGEGEGEEFKGVGGFHLGV